jgi:hypothetical protein
MGKILGRNKHLGKDIRGFDKINLLVLLFQVLEIKTVVKGVKLQTGLCQSKHLLVEKQNLLR